MRTKSTQKEVTAKVSKKTAAQMTQEVTELEKKLEAENRTLAELNAELDLDDDCIKKLKAINADKSLTPEEKQKRKNEVVDELRRKVKELRQHI